jgi:hypothetical protein
MDWLSPTGYVDPDSQWTTEDRAYDELISFPDPVYACTTIYSAGWSSFLELTHTAMLCSKVRFYAVYYAGYVTQIDVDAYYNGVWNHVYEGSYTNLTWVEKSLASNQTITAFRFRFYTPVGDVSPSLVEVDFYGVVVTIPTVTTPAVTNILSTTATGNGNITDIGGENCTKRGICYNLTGNPTVADSKVEETGSFGVGAFTESLINLSPGTTYHVKAYAYNSAGYGYSVEADFTTDKVAPTVTVQAPTDVGQTTVTANGNITASGGENAMVRGFKYGLTQTDTWDAHTDGSFPVGAFTKAITEHLVANTEYWIRAYATNNIGTSYSGWIQFQTSASGTIPTGTKLSICSDYSGYTYKLNSAFTDDGETYESFFVLSTDLAEGQGLHINKRLLDIFSYFTKKESGTAKIYIKQDSEPEWQYAGEVSMTGDEDIVIPHLPTDFMAKHYLIKFLFTNDFEFIGIITESVLIGER